MNPKTEKILLITGIFFLILALGSSVGYFFWSKMNEPQQIVGGDKDEHGCIGSAGYTWCEAKNKCLRIWEEKCTQENNSKENPYEQYVNCLNSAFDKLYNQWREECLKCTDPYYCLGVQEKLDSKQNCIDLNKLNFKKFIEKNNVNINDTEMLETSIINYMDQHDECLCKLIGDPGYPFEKMITTFQLEINSCSESYKTIFSPTINDKWKIGQTYQIKWEPIDPSNNVNIFLMDKNITEGSASKSWQVENISNTGEYSFIVPQLPTGNKYQFYISSKEIMAYSDLFEISN